MDTPGGMEYFRLSRPVGRLGYERTDEGDIIKFMQFDEAAKQEIQRILDDSDEFEVIGRSVDSGGDPHVKVRGGDAARFDQFLRLLSEYGFAVQHHVEG
jgi:hypothetical protein